MSKIHGMMDTGKRSMMNSQTALQTVGHNIANRTTEGFSRQRVEIQTSEAVGRGNLRVGTGSKTAAVTRVNNPYLEKQIGKERAVLGYHQGKADAMSRVEQVYNEQSNKGLNSFMTEFFNAFREFSNQPESLATRTQLKETAEFLTKDFKRVDNQLMEIQRDVDGQVKTHVSQINETTREIAQLNEKIHMVQGQGGPANDERDRRDLLIKKLGEKVNIRYGEGEDGMVTITAGNTAVLVAGYDSKELSTRSTPGSETKEEGLVDIFYKNSEHAEAVSVTNQFTGGAVGGLLEVRDKTINGLQDNVDEMAYGLAQTINSAHRRGFDSYNEQGGDFFEIPDGEVYHAARNMKLNEDIAEDPSRIAGSLDPDSPADNRVAHAISQMQFEQVMSGGKATLDEYYNSMVGQVGIQARRTETAIAAQGDIVKQLTNIRESISGVSLDEETTKLIEYQKAFDASARLIKTADEMFDTVLNLKRM